jgi:hypothetical protein
MYLYRLKWRSSRDRLCSAWLALFRSVHHHLHIEIIVITISSEIAQHAEAPDSRYTIRVTLICSGSSDRHTFFILGRIVNDQSHPCTWRHMDFYRGGQRSLFHQVSYVAHFAGNTKCKAICRTWAPLTIFFSVWLLHQKESGLQSGCRNEDSHIIQYLCFATLAVRKFSTYLSDARSCTLYGARFWIGKDYLR